jgi:hypothetical protein
LDDLVRAKSLLVGAYAENDGVMNSASKTDHKGRTPLHVFSYNKVLAAAIGIPNSFDLETKGYTNLYQQPTFDPESNLERHVLRFLIGDLLAAYPRAMTIHDDDGHIPFEGGLVEWVNLCHNRGITNEEVDTSYLSNFASYTNAVWESTSTTLRSAVKMAGRRSTKTGGDTSLRRAQDIEHGEENRAKTRSPNREEDFNYTGNESVLKAGEQSKDRNFPISARLTPRVRFTLTMLSAVVDQLDGYMRPELFRSKSFRVRSELGYDKKEAFNRAMKERQSFREVNDSVDITSTVVQTGK